MSAIEPREPAKPEFVLVLSEQRMRELLEALDADLPLAQSLNDWWGCDALEASGGGWFAACDPRSATKHLARWGEDIPHPADTWAAAWLDEAARKGY